VILDCVTWTIQNDYGGFDDQSSAATIVEDCRTECSNNRDCTAIDWVVGASTGSQCWLVGSWTTLSGYRPGIQRHNISRTCGQCCQQWLYSVHFGRMKYLVIFFYRAVGLYCRRVRVL